MGTATIGARLLRVWLPAARPKTLAASVAPVLMGTGLAHAAGHLHPGAALAALLGALWIQVGTNFANDYYDHAKGADTAERLGPVRATASGHVPPRVMRRAFCFAFALALACGVYLVLRAGWPVVAIGTAAILLGVLYTGGPVPLAYLGVADLFVLVFFGPVAVAGTYYVQALRFDPAPVWAGLGPGLLAVALLTVNNLRDVETDERARKRTLAVRLGRGYAKGQYATCLLGAALVPWLLHRTLAVPAGTLLASLACLPALPALLAVLRAKAGDRLEGALSGTGRALVLYGLAFALGCVL